jgi:DNA-binding FrmR family transcriptional regulator
VAVHKRHEDVIKRLARVEGHVRGVKRMVEEDKDCPAILLQIAAVRGALDKVSQIILEDHIETCVVKAVKEGKEDEAIKELRDAIARFF